MYEILKTYDSSLSYLKNFKNFGDNYIIVENLMVWIGMSVA